VGVVMVMVILQALKVALCGFRSCDVSLPWNHAAALE
jgi:hypothetical protein